MSGGSTLLFQAAASRSLMSAPATNVRPAPRITMARTAGLASASAIAAISPSGTPWLSALTGGLSIWTTATSSRMEVVTVLFIYVLCPLPPSPRLRRARRSRSGMSVRAGALPEQPHILYWGADDFRTLNPRTHLRASTSALRGLRRTGRDFLLRQGSGGQAGGQALDPPSP